MSVALRRADPSEAAWVNETYEKYEFVPSDLEMEKVIVAEVAGVPAAFGRLVPVGDGAYELGGMVVFEAFRGTGLAKTMVKHLVALAGGSPLYCVPFIPIASLYRNLGFTDCPVSGDLPKKLLEKYEYCLRRYPQSVLLFRYSL